MFRVEPGHAVDVQRADLFVVADLRMERRLELGTRPKIHIGDGNDEGQKPPKPFGIGKLIGERSDRLDLDNFVQRQRLLHFISGTTKQVDQRGRIAASVKDGAHVGLVSRREQVFDVCP